MTLFFFFTVVLVNPNWKYCQNITLKIATLHHPVVILSLQIFLKELPLIRGILPLSLDSLQDSGIRVSIKGQLAPYSIKWMWVLPGTCIESCCTQDLNQVFTINQLISDSYSNFLSKPIEGFHVMSYQANFASHHTRDRHVGFLAPLSGIGKHNKMSHNSSYSSYHNDITKLQLQVWQEY